MSVKVMSWVFENSPYRGKARLVHLTLADHADDFGRCWPSQAEIARKSGCSVEHVRKTVKRMIEDGFVRIVQVSAGRGRSHIYVLETPNSVGVFGGKPPTRRVRNPQIHASKPPNPSPKNHQEPSKNHQLRGCVLCGTETLVTYRDEPMCHPCVALEVSRGR